jgi:hypothetical protein
LHWNHCERDGKDQCYVRRITARYNRRQQGDRHGTGHYTGQQVQDNGEKRTVVGKQRFRTPRFDLSTIRIETHGYFSSLLL